MKIFSELPIRARGFLRFAIVALVFFAAIPLRADDARPIEDASKITNAGVANTKLPTLFIVGDSTVRNGTRGMRGWGEVIAPYFDRTKINVVNRAIGGRSSRTFQTEGRWNKVLAEMKPGDFVLIQFGHNDGGEIAKGSRPRASLKGIGDESREVTIESTGKKEVVHTFGWYMRKYASDAKAKGATPIICSLVPRKIWKDGKIVRASETYGKWAAEAARAEDALFVDLNEIIARQYDNLGAEKVEPLFADEHTHTTQAGAELSAACVISGLKGLEKNPLAPYFSEKADSVAPFKLTE
ncbi:MAG TPA: rhamnogalacturonan acetylesterase [Verrucomicrobiae bacterium]|nr:rhamnogalacturonan acetylesterase [Verrucomicrobiae bacterium]